MPITGRIFDKYGAKRLAMTGMFLLMAATAPFIFLTAKTPIIYIVVLYAVRMFGISMVMMPVTTSGMNALPMNLISHGTAVNNTFRQVASSIGTAILISVLSSVTKNNMPSTHMVKTLPLAFRDKMINATLSGYHAAFIVAVIFCVIGFIITFFLSSKKSTTNGGAKA
jgi:MFS family permease